MNYSTVKHLVNAHINQHNDNESRRGFLTAEEAVDRDTWKHFLWLLTATHEEFRAAYPHVELPSDNEPKLTPREIWAKPTKKKMLTREELKARRDNVNND